MMLAPRVRRRVVRRRGRPAPLRHVVPLLAAALGLVLAGGATRAADPPGRPPNVVLILGDDQAWTDYSFTGHPTIATPRIDRLARESLTFTRGYVPMSLCRPSLATILTGLYPHQHRITGNDPPPTSTPDTGDGGIGRMRLYRTPAYQADLEAFHKSHIDRLDTLAERLGRNGYVSFQSGKWWEGAPERAGFTSAMSHGDPARGGRHGDEGLAIGRQGLEPVKDFVNRAQESESPFLVWYAPMMPHTPHDPPADLLAKYRALAPSEPIAKYQAMCEWFDRTVGELLDHLDERKLADNTIVVYVTDNGWINLPGKSAYAPRSKRSPYEGGIRTPIMVRWPGHVAARMDTTHPASSVDLVPTVLSLCGVAPPAGLPGLDLTNEKAVAGRDAVFGEIFEHDIPPGDDPAASLTDRWVVAGTWKLILPHADRFPDRRPELYDLAADPSEQHDLAAAHPDRVEALTARLDRWWTPTASPAGPTSPTSVAPPATPRR